MKVGVAGTGHLGFHHARILRGLAGDVAVYDPDHGRMERVAAELGVRPSASLDALLDGCDAVVVASTTVSHHDVASRALEAGVHVLVEKPLAATVEQAEDLRARAEARGTVLAVGHVERFNPAVVAASGLISAPLFVEAHRLAPFKPRGTDVSVVLDLMIHDIDLVLSFVGSPVAEVHASGVAVLTGKTDIASARIRFVNGAVANLTASRISREPMRKLRFFQEKAYISVDFAGRSVEAMRVEGESIVPVAVEVGDSDPLTSELEDFLRACREGARPLVGAAEGVMAMRAADMIAACMRDGRPGRA